jgi:hypothetical protein
MSSFNSAFRYFVTQIDHTHTFKLGFYLFSFDIRAGSLLLD